MFIGHYAPALAAKALKKSIPLWVLFLAAQTVDIFFAIFLLLGIEKVRIVPGITASNSLDLYYFPFTHSLVAALIWSIAFGIIYLLFTRAKDRSSALIVGLVVFSHWVLDLIVHIPDLTIAGGSFMMGFGLWNYPVVAIIIELIIFFAAMFLYIKKTKPVSGTGRYGMIIFGIIMVIMQIINHLMPPPGSDKAFAVTCLIVLLAFSAVPFWLDKKRN